METANVHVCQHTAPPLPSIPGREEQTTLFALCSRSGAVWEEGQRKRSRCELELSSLGRGKGERFLQGPSGPLTLKAVLHLKPMVWAVGCRPKLHGSSWLSPSMRLQNGDKSPSGWSGVGGRVKKETGNRDPEREGNKETVTISSTLSSPGAPRSQ